MVALVRPRGARLADAERRDRDGAVHRAPRPATRSASATTRSASAAGACGPTARRRDVVARLKDAGMRMTSSSPGMGADDRRPEPQRPRARRPRRPRHRRPRQRPRLREPGRPAGAHARAAPRRPAARRTRPTTRAAPRRVALALHHGEDCGISFVATAPYARRQGLATDVMARVALDAQRGRPHEHVAAGHRAGREALPRARLPPGVRHAAVGAQAVTPQPGAPGRPLLPALRRRGGRHLPAVDRVPQLRLRGVLQPKPVGVLDPARPRRPHHPHAPRHRAEPGPLDDARRLRRPRRVGRRRPRNEKPRRSSRST